MGSIPIYKLYSSEIYIHDYSQVYWRELKIDKNVLRSKPLTCR